mgnify:CR=1 FL=1
MILEGQTKMKKYFEWLSNRNTKLNQVVNENEKPKNESEIESADGNAMFSAFHP